MSATRDQGTTPRADDVVPTTARVALILIATSPVVEKYDLEFEIAGSPIPTPLYTAATLLAVVLLVVSPERGKGVRWPGILVLAWLSIVVVASLVRIIFLERTLTDPNQAVVTLLHLSQLAGVAIVSGLTMGPRYAKMCAGYFATAVTVAVVIGWAQFLDQNLLGTGLSEALGLRSRLAGPLARPISVFSEPAYFGYFSQLAFWLSLYAHRNQNRRQRAVLLTGAILPLAVGPLVVLVASTAIYAVLTRRLRWMAYSPVIAIAVLGALSTSPGQYLRDRIDRIRTNNDPSANVRSALNDASISLIEDNQLLGLGPGQTRFHLPELVHVPGVELTAYNQAGNSYLAFATDYGLVIAVMFFGLLVLLAAMAAKKQPAITLIFAVYFISWFSVSSVGLPQFWIPFGIALGALSAPFDPEVGEQ